MLIKHNKLRDKCGYKSDYRDITCIYIANYEHNHPSNVASIYQVWRGNINDVIFG